MWTYWTVLLKFLKNIKQWFMTKKEDIAVKRQKLYSLKLSMPELVHLRDLFGVLLPPSFDQTVSQRLAASNGAQAFEAKLWKKIHRVCCSANIPTDDSAPDYIVTAAAQPELDIYPLNLEQLVDVTDEDEDDE
jgi:hypothetical protein